MAHRTKRTAASVSLSAAYATCTLYQPRDYGGARWTLQSGDEMKMVNAPVYGVFDGRIASF